MEVNRARRDSAVQYDYVSSKPRTRRNSYSLGSGSISDEEARLRQLKRDVKKAEDAKRKAEEAQWKAEEDRRRLEEQRKEAARQKKKDAEIRRQNENIASRPAAPAPPPPARYRRGSVSIQQPNTVLTDAMRNTYIDPEKERRRREKQREQQRREEEAAQQDRLRARLAPQRSNSVSYGGSRRPVVYNEPYM